MTAILLIIVAVLAFSSNSISLRAFQLHLDKTGSGTQRFQAIYCFIAAAAYFLMAGQEPSLDSRGYLLSILFGIFFASACLNGAACYVCGPMSLTSIITNASVMIPVLYSCIVLKESISVPQIFGCVLLLITFVLSSLSSQKDRDVNVKWIVLVLIAFLSNGVTAVLQKQYKLNAADPASNRYMALAYAVAAVIVLNAFLLERRKSARSSEGTASGKLTGAPYHLLYVLLALVAGLGSFGGNGILMSLSTLLPAPQLYPFINGGLALVVSLVSYIFFREKLTLPKLIALFTGLGSIVLLNL